MSRTLIHIIGALAAVAVLAIGIVLVAGPLALQAVAVFDQTVTVANSNLAYSAQVDALHQEEERIGDIEASVAGLQTQITAANDLDDVFELVAKAAQSSGVEITSITAGEAVPFVERTSALAPGEVAAAPAPAPADPDAQASTAPPAEEATTTDISALSTAAPAGRTQIDFTIAVSAADMSQVVAFLDALRAGPRLLAEIQSTVTPTGIGFDVSLSALTFVLPDEG